MTLTLSDTLAIAGLLVGPLGFYLGYRARRPRLVMGGSGCGTVPVGTRDLMLGDVSFINMPKFLGFPVNREAAVITEARLFDPEIREFVGHPLMWRVEGSRTLSRTATIESGAQRTLCTVAKDRYADEFFPYHAADLSDEPARSPERYRDRKKEFILYLRDRNGRKYLFQTVVRNAEQGAELGPRDSLLHRIRRRIKPI